MLVFIVAPRTGHGTLQAQNKSSSLQEWTARARALPNAGTARESKIAEITPSIALLGCTSVFPVPGVNTMNTPFCDSSPPHHVLTQLPAAASPSASSPLPCPLILHPHAAGQARATTVGPFHRGFGEEAGLQPGFKGGRREGRWGQLREDALLGERKEEARGPPATRAVGAR